MNKRIVILGSASGMPQAERSSSSFVLETNSQSYLFDCGEGTSSSILKHKIDYDKISTIFITHMHPDHCIGIFSLIQMMYLTQREKSLEIFLPEESMTQVKSFLNTLYLFQEKLGFEIYFYTVKPGSFYKDPNLKIKAFPNLHLAENGKIIEKEKLLNKMESFSLEIRLKNKKIVYSGDVGGLDDLKMILPDSDILLTECMHLDIERLLALIKSSKVKSTVFTHIPPELEKEKEVITKRANELKIKGFQFAFDGLALSL
ncbi:MAG: hypothetical protein AMJ90_03805 [candidate division Zixibacteria bacterium SM23_73_2]|nr:MAG: hypothetical protein AMJ90_03805 [candidate division Zixibacteria bacterium SM23_73_2]